MKRHLRFLRPVVVLLIFVGAVWLLYNKLSEFHYSDLEEGLGQIPAGCIAAAVGLTVFYYLILVAYDLLAVRYVGCRLPLGKIALASFTGYASSYNFGILLGGMSVRYRLYSAWGLSAIQIAQVIAILGLTFWLGVFALGGLVFVVRPFAIPPALHLPITNVWSLGLVLLAVVAAYLALCALRRRPIKLLGWNLPLPPVKMGLLQIAIASMDLIVAAGVFYALLSRNTAAGYPTFLGVYLLSIVAAVCTQVPGGLGVFELLVLVLLAPADPPRLFAALVVWRAIFYLMPLVAAAVLLGAHELLLRLS